MKLQDHVLKSLDACMKGELEEALLHACFAIDATAKNISGFKSSGKTQYKECIRGYWWLIEAFIGVGLNLEETRWTHLKLDNGYGKLIQNPDLADIIYHVFRCSQAHAEEIPVEFHLTLSTKQEIIWIIGIEDHSVHIPDKIVFALLAVAVFCKANLSLKSDGEHFLSWGSENLGYTLFPIKDSWGKESEIRDFLSKQKILRVKLAGL